MSSARSFLSVGLKTKTNNLTQPYLFGVTNHTDQSEITVLTAILIPFLPPVFSDEGHDLLLRVGPVRDSDRLLHEGLVEIHLVHFQGQLLGHLKHHRHQNQHPTSCIDRTPSHRPRI